MRRLACLAAVAVAFAAASASAGPASFEADSFHPSDTAGGYLSVDGASVAPHLGFTFGIWSSWAHDPLVLRDPAGLVPAHGEIIGQQLAVDLIGSFAILDRLELGVDLPYIPRQETDNELLRLPGGINPSGLGDLRLDLKVRAFTARLRGDHRLLLAVIAGLRLPTGNSDAFLGEGGVSGYPRLALEWRHPRASAAINFGAVLRSTTGFGNLAITHQLAWGAALRIVAGRGFEFLGEVRGLVGVALPGDASLTAGETPIEVDAGIVWRSPFGLAITLAGGGGLTRGYGEPDGRVILGVGWAKPPKYGEWPPRERVAPPAPPPVPTLPVAPVEPPPPSDRDHDGVLDAADRCPDVPGVKENDGCPDVDSDGDGLVDRLDKCPFEAEVYNGNQDDDGCPDSGAAVLDVAIPALTPRTPFDGTHLDGTVAWKLMSVVSHLIAQHTEWDHVTVACAYGKVDSPDECRRRANAVQKALTRDFGVDPQKLRVEIGSRTDDKRRGMMIGFLIDQ